MLSKRSKQKWKAHHLQLLLLHLHCLNQIILIHQRRKKKNNKVSPRAKLSIIVITSCNDGILFDLCHKIDFETLTHSKNSVSIISRKVNHNFLTNYALQNANGNQVKPKSSFSIDESCDTFSFKDSNWDFCFKYDRAMTIIK